MVDTSPLQAPSGLYTFETIHKEAVDQLKQLQSENRLSDQDLAVLTGTKSGEDVLNYARDVILKCDANSKRREKIKRVLEPLILRLDRYDSAVSSLVNALPSAFGANIAGLIWGSLKFVLMIANDIVQTWETVLDTLEQITKVLPSVKAYVELYGKSQLQLLREPLVSIYADMISFGLRAVKLINKSKLRMMLQSLGKSLQGELNNMIQSMETHRKEVDRVAGVEHMNATNELKLGQDMLRQDFQTFVSQQKDISIDTTHNIYITLPARSEEVSDSQRAISRQLIEPEPIAPFIEAPLDLLSPNFSGREQELAKVKQGLQNRQIHDSSRFILHGMPGVGKSQLALRFAQSAFEARLYTYVLWISTQTIEKLTQQFASLVDLLALPDVSESNQSSRLAAVRRWLEASNEKTRWLLIFDNVDASTVESLRSLTPRKHTSGSILFTTRSDRVALALAAQDVHRQQTLELRPPSPKEATDLLFRGSGLAEQSLDPSWNSQAEELVNSIGRLPLAINQATSFMKQTGYSVGDLLGLYKSEHKLEILEWEDDLSNYAEKSVAATFVSTFHEIKRTDLAGFGLLCLLSFLDAECIPVKMLMEGASVLRRGKPQPPPLVRESSTFVQKLRETLWAPARPREVVQVQSSKKRLLSDFTQDPDFLRVLAILQSPVRLQSCIIKIQNLCLIQRQVSRAEATLRMHDLIQYLIQHKLIEDTQKEMWLDAAINLVCGAFEKLENPSLPSLWTAYEALVPHIQALAKKAKAASFESERLVRVQLVVADYFENRGQYQEAEDLYKFVLEYFKREHGSEDALTLSATRGLATVHAQQDDYEEAEELFRLIYEIKQQMFGADHRYSLRARENLATVINAQGRHEEAESMFLQIVEGHVQRRGGGPKCLDALKSRRSLGLVYVEQRRYKDAERLFQKVFDEYESQYGSEDPNTLTAMHDLAYAHYCQREYDIAESLFEKALRGSEAVLTKSHPMTHMAAQNLALVYDFNGKQDAAEEQCVRAIAGLERTLRPNHSDTLRAIQILAQIRAHQGRLTEAVQILQRVLDGREETLGPDAKYTVWTREKLEYLKQTGTLDVRRDK